MPLQPPPIDDRSYRQLFEEALARIPVHTPEWTNRNDADPGITLLQLWAYMSETLLYRASLIPERNRLAFLRLLGYERQPAQAATGMVAFENKRGPLDSVPVERDLELAAGSVPFRTDNGLAILPIEATTFVKRRAAIDPAERAEVAEEYATLYASFAESGVEFDYYETAAVDWSAGDRTPLDLANTVDGALWIALLARPGDPVDPVRDTLQNTVLTLGVVPDVTTTEKVLPAGSSDPLTAEPGLEFQLPNVTQPLPDEAEGRVATYVPVPTTGQVDLLTAPGVVQLQLPDRPSLDMWSLDPTEDGVGNFPPALEGEDAARLVTWIRVRPAASSQAGTPARSAEASTRLRWVGANAAMLRQRSHVSTETLGKGTGRGDQIVHLANTPVLVESLRLTVDGQAWQRVDDLATASPEAPLARGSSPVLADPVERTAVYTVDRATGTVRFGDGIHGRRPPLDAVIRASYDYGGGRAGMVAVGAITKGPELPAGITVSNPVRTWGGDEPESVAEAERRTSGYLRHRDRLVTVEDFREIVARTPGVDLGRVEVLPLHNPTLGDVTSPGAVTLMLIPRYDTAHPEAPQPDRFFLDAVCTHLDARRLVTTEVHLRGPAYERVWVSVGIDVLPGRDLAIVREAVKDAVQTFLSPLAGGNQGEGWPLATDVERLEIWAVAARVEGVAKVVGVRLANSDGLDTDHVEISGLQLPRLAALSVRRDEPQALEELRGAAPPIDDEGAPRLPIPFVPAEC